MKNYLILVLLFMDCLQSNAAQVKKQTENQSPKLLQHPTAPKETNKVTSKSILVPQKEKSITDATKPSENDPKKERKLPVNIKGNVGTSVSQVSESSIEEVLEASTGNQDQPAKSINYEIDDLDKELADNIDKLIDISGKLKSDKKLFEKNRGTADKGKKAVEDADLTNIITASAILKAGNRSLKHYIDHFVLTPDVMEKYDAFLKSKKGHKSSTDDVLEFMITTYKSLGLRKHEMQLFSHALKYNKVLNEFYSNYIYMPLPNKAVDTFENKVLEGMKLALFVKQYMALIRSLKDNINYLDYDNLEELFYPNPPNRNQIVGSRLVYKEGEKTAQPQKKQSNIIPIKIIIGTDKYGEKKNKATKPSDIIQEGLDIHPQLSSLDLSEIPDDQKKLFIQKELEKLNGNNRQAKLVNPIDHSMINLSELKSATAKAQSEHQNSISNKIEQDNENDPKELDRLLGGSTQTISPAKDDKKSTFYAPQTSLDNNEENSTVIQQQSESKKTVENSQLAETFVKHPSKLRSIDKTRLSALEATLQNDILEPQGPLHMMPSGVTYDANNMPVNLEIYRAPDIEKIDTKYEDTKHSFLGFEASRMSMLKPQDPEMVKARKEFKEQMVKGGPLRMISGNIWADNMPTQSNQPIKNAEQTNSKPVQTLARNLPLAPQFNSRFANPASFQQYNMLQAPSLLMNQPDYLGDQPKSSLANKTDALYRELLRQQI